MRMDSGTASENVARLFSERPAHRFTDATRVALHDDVCSLGRNTEFEEAQERGALRGSTVDIFLPREVRQMAVLARDDEPHWNDARRLRSLGAMVMHVTCSVRSPRVGFQLEYAEVERSDQIARRASDPSWKGSNRHTTAVLGVERTDIVVRRDRRAD